MSPLQRAVLRFLGVYAVFAGVELLERVAYRAGVVDAAAEADKLTHAKEAKGRDLEAVDVSDVVAAHAHCCAGGSSC